MRLAFWSLGSLALVALVTLGPQPSLAQQPPPAAPQTGFAAPAPAAPPPPPEYTTQILVPGSWFHGVHGLAFNKDDQLFAGSVVGQAIYRVNVDSGEVDEAVVPPNGMADDIAFAPDGTMAWTGFLTGEIWSRKGNENQKRLAAGLPGINSLAFTKDGRLFATQVFLGDALYEIDVKGEKPPRKIMEGMGGLNGFEFGPDGLLYGPLWFKGEVVKIDVAKAEMTTVSRGFRIPAAVNFDSTNKLYVIDTALGQVVSMNPLTDKLEPVANPQKTVVATLKPGLDNLAIDSRNRVFVTNMADNSVQLIDAKTGAARTIVEGRLAMPADIAVASEGGKETVYVADTFSLRRVDGVSGKVDEVVRTHGDIHEYPLGVSVGAKNAVMTSWFSGTAHVVDRATGKTVRLVKDLKAPMDAVEHADGSLLVLELGTGSLLRIAANGERTTVTSGLAAPVAVAMGANNMLYVSEVGSGAVAQIDLATGARKAVAEGLLGPEGLDVGPDGRLYVAEVGRAQVLAIDPRTGERVVVARNLSLGLPAVPGLPPSYVTTGVAVGASGAVYVSSDVRNALYKLTPPQ